MEYYCDSSRRPASGLIPADLITERSSAVASQVTENFSVLNNTNAFATSSTTMVATPPPGLLPAECNPLLHPYSFPHQLSYFSGPLPFSPSDYFVQGSSHEDRPLSSPSSEVGREEVESVLGTIDCKRSASPMASFQLRAVLQDSNFDGSYSSGLEEPIIPDSIKMPKRRGGIQLWQFLYALLTDPDHMHPELIEWTCNIREKEFRLLEPEAIAVWWGYHKNKVNVNYEKFSRSLRYYYDKGILRKIPGERYVYRFCIDPDLMYKHIGISDCRPQIKPMPEGARQAISMSHGEQSHSLSSTDSPIVALAPEPLKAPTSPSNTTYLLGASPPLSSYSRPIERSSSFNVIYPQNPTNPSEELPCLVSSASLPDMYSFERFAATPDLYNSPTVSPGHSLCDSFSTSMPDDFVQTHAADHFDAGYGYNSPTTMSETLWAHSFANGNNCFYASQLQTCYMAWE